MENCLFCANHETLNDGRIGDVKCLNPDGNPITRSTITCDEIDLSRFNIKDLEKGACHAYKTSET
jgi:hypothetical protein